MPETDVTLLLVKDDAVDAEAIQRAFRQQRIANPFVVARDGIEAPAALRGDTGRLLAARRVPAAPRCSSRT